MSPTADIDVRELDGEPFTHIVAALEALDAGERLELVAPFEPVPLYGELADRGFDHETEQDGDLFRVSIEHA